MTETIVDEFARLVKELRSEWREYSACKGFGPDIFFSDEPGDVEAARSICAGCSVQMECLATAVLNMDEGVCGGFTAEERKAIVLHQRRNNQYYRYDLDVL